MGDTCVTLLPLLLIFQTGGSSFNITPKVVMATVSLAIVPLWHFILSTFFLFAVGRRKVHMTHISYLFFF